MTQNRNISADQCGEVCVEKYIECTQRKYTGCVEEIRVCREECPTTRMMSPAIVQYIRALGA